MTKKLHIVLLTAAALATLLSGCTKVVNLDTGETAPVPVSFQIGNLPVQTKSVNGGSLLNEGCTNFWCNAWFTDAADNVQRFMDTAEIRPDVIPNPAEWAPVQSYFWPVTGTVDFFSFATARSELIENGHLSVTRAKAGSTTTATFTISDYTVSSHDNILVADAVYYATKANAGNSSEVVDTVNTHIPSPRGVPTLMRHVLASVEMWMMLKTTSPKITTDTSYEVVVTNVTLHNFRDQGSLTLTNSYSGSTYGTQAWTPASDGNNLGWVPTTGSVPRDVDLTPDTDNVITLPAGQTNGANVIFLGSGAVMPQSLEGTLSLSVTLTIRTKHGDTIYNEDRGVVLSAALSPEPGAAWNMNQKIVYHVEIDPVTTTLSFDPAISAWDSLTEVGSVTL